MRTAVSDNNNKIDPQSLFTHINMGYKGYILVNAGIGRLTGLITLIELITD